MTFDIFKDKKNLIVIGAGALLVVLCIVAIVMGNSSKKNKAPEFSLVSAIYGNMNYISDSGTNLPNGNTSISSPNRDFILNGKFQNGVFTSGYITMTNDGIDYYLDGTFEDFSLIDGTMKITTKTQEIIKTGEFTNNKLNGMGSLRITNKDTNEVEFFYAGKFKNDIPIFE